MKLEQAARQVVDAWDLGEFSTRMDETITALREALAEPQITTPDVCGEVCARAKLCYGCNKDLEEANAKLAEQAEQKQVCIDWDTKTDEPIMGYAAPVRTKDLTDDEIAAVTGYRKSGATWPVVEEVARAVIAADREKNK